MDYSRETSNGRSEALRFQKVRLILVILTGISVVLELSPAFIIIPSMSILLMMAEEKFNYRLILSRVSGKAYFLTLIFAIQALWFLPMILDTGSTRYVERTLPFLLYPLMISSTSINRAQLRVVIKSFVGAVAVSYLLSLLAAVYHFKFSVPRWGRASDFFFHEQFTMGLFNIHPTYYSLLGCVATLFTLVFLTGVRRVLLIVFLTFIILLINARITQVIQAALVLSFALKDLSKGLSVKRFAILVASGIALFFAFKLTGSIYDYPHRKILVNVKSAWERSYEADIGDADGGIVMRMAMWRSAMNVIGEHPILGVGLGYENHYLTTEYQKNKFSFLAQNAFNAHNQLLSYTIGLGLLGISLLAAVYFRLLAEAYKKRCRQYLAFLAIFACAALTESLFNRLLGVSLFAFFNSLLILKLANNDK